MSNDSSKGYQFTILNGVVTAVYVVQNGHAKFEEMDRDEAWTVDGNNIIKTETEHGRVKTTLYSDVDGDGIFAKMSQANEANSQIIFSNVPSSTVDLFSTTSGEFEELEKLENHHLDGTNHTDTPESLAIKNAVDLHDAIAILKLMVGLPVNGSANGLDNALLSYQALAADFDEDGEVGLQDAIGVLKLVVGLDAPQPTWHFHNELETGISPTHEGQRAYLNGDVDSSYSGPAGASDLVLTQTNDFITLVANHPEESSAVQFGG
jgi:hypothetical protein